MTFYLNLPKNCPPTQDHVQYETIFRIIASSELDIDNDLKSYSELYPENERYNGK